MKRFLWYLKQLLPLTYRSHYGSASGAHFAVWRMWFGRVFAYEDHLIEPNQRQAKAVG